MSCDRCGKAIHFPFEETSPAGMDLSGGAAVCDGCDLPEGLCSCAPTESSEPDYAPAGRVYAPVYYPKKTSKLPAFGISYLYLAVGLGIIAWMFWIAFFR